VLLILVYASKEKKVSNCRDTLMQTMLETRLRKKVQVEIVTLLEKTLSFKHTRNIERLSFQQLKMSILVAS